MKQTFSIKYFDWTLITISLLFSVDAVLSLLNRFDFSSTYMLRIVFALTSVLALISLIVKNINGERYSRIFIIVSLVIPAILVLNQFLTDFIFYGTNRLYLIQNPILFLKLILGIALFVLTIKYSRQTKFEQIKDLGILTMSVGIFTVVLVIIKAIQVNILLELNELAVWKIIIKSLIGLMIIYFGFRLKNDKMKLKFCVILTLVLMSIYGLI